MLIISLEENVTSLKKLNYPNTEISNKLKFNAVRNA